MSIHFCIAMSYMHEVRVSRGDQDVIDSLAIASFTLPEIVTAVLGCFINILNCSRCIV